MKLLSTLYALQIKYYEWHKTGLTDEQISSYKTFHEIDSFSPGRLDFETVFRAVSD